MRPPNIVVFHSPSVDVTKSPAVRAAMARVVKANPGALTSSYFSTGNRDVRVARPAHDVPAGLSARAGRLDVKSGAAKMRAAAAAGLPAGITVNVTGRDALEEASDSTAAAGRASCWRR